MFLRNILSRSVPGVLLRPPHSPSPCSASLWLPFSFARAMSNAAHAHTHEDDTHHEHETRPVPEAPAPGAKDSTCTVCATSGCTSTQVTKPTTPVTFYMRELPPLCIPFSSKEGKDLFKSAMAAGTMEGFFKLMEQFRTQEEPSYCGLASLAMVLNALAIDPRRPWKGPWRWFTEELLDCCEPLEKVRTEGIVFNKVACLGRCNGAEVDEYNFGTFSEEEFRRHVIATVTDPAAPQHMLVSYARKALGQTGDGHFSPIGGYHRERDLALVLDVAAFKYPPHWVPLPTLFHAMSYVDATTGRPRGYMMVRNKPMLESVMFTLGIRAAGWEKGHVFLTRGALAAAEQARSAVVSADLTASPGVAVPWTEASGELRAAAAAFVRSLVCALPLSGLDFVVSREGANHVGCLTTCVPYAQRHHVLFELRGMQLLNLVQRALGLPETPPPHAAGDAQAANRPQEGESAEGIFADNPLVAERTTILLLLLPPEVWAACPPGPLRGVLADLVDLTRGSRSLLRAEIAYLQHQLAQIGGVTVVGHGPEVRSPAARSPSRADPISMRPSQ